MCNCRSRTMHIYSTTISRRLAVQFSQLFFKAEVICKYVAGHIDCRWLQSENIKTSIKLTAYDTKCLNALLQKAGAVPRIEAKASQGDSACTDVSVYIPVHSTRNKLKVHHWIVLPLEQRSPCLLKPTVTAPFPPMSEVFSLRCKPYQSESVRPQRSDVTQRAQHPRPAGLLPGQFQLYVQSAQTSTL